VEDGQQWKRIAVVVEQERWLRALRPGQLGGGEQRFLHVGEACLRMEMWFLGFLKLD